MLGRIGRGAAIATAMVAASTGIVATSTPNADAYIDGSAVIRSIRPYAVKVSEKCYHVHAGAKIRDSSQDNTDYYVSLYDVDFRVLYDRDYIIKENDGWKNTSDGMEKYFDFCSRIPDDSYAMIVHFKWKKKGSSHVTDSTARQNFDF